MKGKTSWENYPTHSHTWEGTLELKIKCSCSARHEILKKVKIDWDCKNSGYGEISKEFEKAFRGE